MSVSEKQAQLIEDLSVIEDRQERLAAVVDRARRRPAFPAEFKTDAHRVHGCISQVWIVAEVRNGAFHLQFDADSPLVKGLVALMVDLYEGAAPADVVATEPEIFEKLGLARDLTSTRQNGLAAVRAQIRALAKSC